MLDRYKGQSESVQRKQHRRERDAQRRQKNNGRAQERRISSKHTETRVKQSRHKGRRK